MAAASCSLCCTTCLLDGPTLLDPSSNSLEQRCNSLPAGILFIRLHSTNITCSHNHSHDNWHQFPRLNGVQSVVDPEDEPLVRLLDFLIRQRFLAATCQASEPGYSLTVRIYLFPWDVSTDLGSLLARDASVRVKAGQYLRVLLPQIRQDTHIWQGASSPDCTATRYLLNVDFDNRTMSEIYSDLPSPKCSEGYTIYHIQGMRSSLYNYQQESVSAMLARELSPTSVNDPLYISIKGVDGTAFYLQPSTMELRRECPQVIQSRGGILCEELGTGKTVMMLSLILATLDQLPQPEESIFDLHPIMTPLSFRHFSTAECNTARERLSHGSLSRQRKSMSERRETLRVPSLVEILLHHCRAYPEKLDLHMYQEDLEQRNLWEPLRLCTPFYHQYDLAMPELVHTRRNYTDPGPRKMYLSSATIVVVPVNLFQQWRNEIMKHCYDTLRVLEIKTDTVFPRAVDLASDYDIILMAYDRFSREATKNKVSELYSWRLCSCPCYPGTRVPACTCKTGSTNVTPLLQVRWKRLVIDEGHISASIVTNLTPFAKMLSVERKWIITGTPTTNLLGLQFGTSSEVQYPGPPRTEGSPASDYIGSAEAIELNAVARKWTPDDREDLRKLSNMIIHFLEVPQFATGTKTAFDEAVIQPLMGDPRPRPGAIEVLEQVMSSVMIRHRIADVEEDVLLPLMHQETILLDLDQYAVKSYNALQASIVINAVDSERTDQDYLFHPSNAAALQRLVLNMSQVMFWHVDDEKRYNVDEMVKSSNEFLQNARRRNVSPQDLLLLEQAIAHVKSAGNDLLWRAMQSNAFVFHRIHDVSSGVYEAWSPLPIRVSHGCVHVLTSERLIKLRSFVMQHPLASISQITAAGLDFEREAELRRYERERTRRDARGQSNTFRKEREVARQIVAPEKREEVQREFVAAQKRLLAHFQDEEQEPFAEVHPQPVTPSWLLSQSPLAGIRMGNSTSSKLDFILNEVLQHSPTEKFLIFSSSPLTLGFVAEGLELVQVKFIQYTTAVKPKLREQLVTTFETSDLYRVFLMELKHGARGLNLVSASRVIFCEPVWQADVEIQAIKRVHRIGQTRPVTVQTLAIRSTWEEMVVSRREALKSKGKSIKQTRLTDDRSIRDFIANPTFLQENAATRLEFSLPLFQLKQNQNEDKEPNDALAIEVREDSPLKKRRLVRFADA